MGVSTAEAAEQLECGFDALHRMLRRGEIEKPTKIAGKLIWSRKDIANARKALKARTRKAVAK